MTKQWPTALRNLVVLTILLFVILSPLQSFAQQNPSTGYVPYDQLDAFGGPGPDIDDDTDFQYSLDPFGGPGPDIDDDLDTTTGGNDGIAGNGNEVSDDPQNPQGSGTAPGSRAEMLKLMDANSTEKIYNFLIMAGGFFASFGSLIFDLAFESLVLKFGCLMTTQCGADGWGGGSVGGAVDSLWTIVRDLFNILFIFALVFIGLRLILNSDDTSTQRAVGYLIAAALLVNFSLYAAKLVVDITNFTAVEIHQAVVGGIGGEEGFGVTAIYEDEAGIDREVDIVTTNEDVFSNSSIAGAFMQVMSINTFFNTTTEGMNAILLGFLAFLFLVYLGFVLAYAGAMIVVRFVAIIFLLIFSPFMFLGWILPQLEGYAKKWRQTFLGYALYMPAFIFLIYVALFVMIQVSSLGIFAGKSYSQAIDEGGNNFTIFLLFVLGTGFLYAATKVAGAISNAGAVVGMNAASSAARKITIGAGAAGAAWAGGRGTSSILGGGANKLGKAWDERNAASGKPRGRTGMYFRDKLKSLEDNKYGGSTSFKQRRDEEKAEKKRHATAQATQKVKTSVTERKKAGDAATDEQKIAMERAIVDATTPQLEKLGASTLAEDYVAGALSQTQFDNLMKSDELTDADKAKIAEARGKDVKARLTDDKTGEFDISKASVNQLQALGARSMIDNAGRLKASQMDDLKKKLTETEFDRINNAREDQLEAMGTDVFIKRDNKEIAKLPKDILSKESNIEHLVKEDLLSGDMLKQIARESKVDKRKLGQTIAAKYNAAGKTPPNDILGYLEGGEGRVYGLTRADFSSGWDDPVT